MPIVRFGVGISIGILIGAIIGGVVGLMVGHGFGSQSVYDEICGYDYVVDIQDQAERDSICDHLRGR